MEVFETYLIFISDILSRTFIYYILHVNVNSGKFKLNAKFKEKKMLYHLQNHLKLYTEQKTKGILNLVLNYAFLILI